MKFKTQEIIRGATRIAFKNDSGENVEAGSIFIDVSLDRADGGGFGTRTDAKKCANLGIIDRIKHNPFPFLAELDVEEQATGKATKLVVTDIRPLKRADGSALPQPVKP